MSIRSVSSFFNGIPSFSDLSTQEQKPVDKAAPIQNVVNLSTGPRNMLAGNFANFNKEESRYIQATKISLALEASMHARQNAILENGVLLGQMAEKYSEKNLVGLQAEQKILKEKSQTTEEESERNLDEIRTDIEERATQAIEGESKADGVVEEVIEPESGNTQQTLPVEDIKQDIPDKVEDKIVKAEEETYIKDKTNISGNFSQLSPSSSLAQENMQNRASADSVNIFV